MCGVKTTKRGCNSLWTTVLSTLWYVCSFILFCKLLFSWIASWIAYDDFFKNFQETYNSRLREKYGDNPSTHPDFDPDLWMEVGSSGGSDENRVYGLSNTTAENLRSAHSLSTVGKKPCFQRSGGPNLICENNWLSRAIRPLLQLQTERGQAFRLFKEVGWQIGHLHQYRAPSLRSSLPWNNNINNSRRIIMSSVT